MKTILVVDDNKYIRDLLLLTFTGFFNDCVVLTAENGAKAVEIFDSTPVNAIITDLSMPVMDGYRFIQHVRSRSSHIPVIAMTARFGAEVDRRLKSLGVERCLEKPFDLQRVMQEIVPVFRLTRNVGALREEPAAAGEIYI